MIREKSLLNFQGKYNHINCFSFKNSIIWKLLLKIVPKGMFSVVDLTFYLPIWMSCGQQELEMHQRQAS